MSPELKYVPSTEITVLKYGNNCTQVQKKTYPSTEITVQNHGPNRTKPYLNRNRRTQTVHPLVALSRLSKSGLNKPEHTRPRPRGTAKPVVFTEWHLQNQWYQPSGTHK